MQSSNSCTKYSHHNRSRSGAGDQLQISKDDSTLIMQQKVATLRALEVQNREMKAQVM